MAKEAKQKTYEIAVGLKKGHKVTKNERKKPRPSTLKGVSTNHYLFRIHSLVLQLAKTVPNPTIDLQIFPSPLLLSERHRTLNLSDHWSKKSAVLLHTKRGQWSCCVFRVIKERLNFSRNVSEHT